MKKAVLLLMFFISTAISSQAQETSKIVMVKVYEVTRNYTFKAAIKVFNPDNTVETIDLAKPIVDYSGSPEQDENDKRVRDVLEKIVARGYTLKSSHQSVYSIILTTTYIFERK